MIIKLITNFFSKYDINLYDYHFYITFYVSIFFCIVLNVKHFTLLQLFKKHEKAKYLFEILPVKITPHY